MKKILTGENFIVGRSEDEVKDAVRLLGLGKEAKNEVARATSEKPSFEKISLFRSLLQVEDEAKQPSPV